MDYSSLGLEKWTICVRLNSSDPAVLLSPYDVERSIVDICHCPAHRSKFEGLRWLEDEQTWLYRYDLYCDESDIKAFIDHWSGADIIMAVYRISYEHYYGLEIPQA